MPASHLCLQMKKKVADEQIDRLPTQKQIEGACSADLDMKLVGLGALCNHRVCPILPKNIEHTSVII